MDSPNAVLTGVGVDYLTATYVGRAKDSSLQGFGRYLVEEETKRGERQRNFSFSGYRGLHAGAASFGVRHDGVVLRISSHVAAEHWAQAYNLATNVTRLDVQATCRPVDGPTATLDRHHKELLEKQASRGRPASFKFWYGPNGPEAAILGKRVSDWFGRGYDKGLESGLPEYRGCLRYEVETKRHVAKNLCAVLDQAQSVEAEIFSVVSKFFSNRGFAMGRFTWAPERTCAGSKTSTGLFESEQVSFSDLNIVLGEGRARRTSAWLYNAVRPSVQRLVELGHRDLVLEALGLNEGGPTAQERVKGLPSDFNRWR